MANLADLQAEVKRQIQDKSFNSIVIKMFLNKAITDICNGVPIIWPENGDQTLSQPMPDLYTIGTVDTSLVNAYVSLPTGYQRDVCFVASENGYEVTQYENFIDFVRNFPLLNMSGSVVGYSVKGSKLYYQGIPTSADTLTVHYYTSPTAMTEDDDIPSGIPSRFHETLIVYDACLRIFNEIYEGTTEQHSTVAAFEKKRMIELIALDSVVQRDQGSVIFKCR